MCMCMFVLRMEVSDNVYLGFQIHLSLQSFWMIVDSSLGCFTVNRLISPGKTLLTSGWKSKGIYNLQIVSESVSDLCLLACLSLFLLYFHVPHACIEVRDAGDLFMCFMPCLFSWKGGSGHCKAFLRCLPYLIPNVQTSWLPPLPLRTC